MVTSSTQKRSGIATLQECGKALYVGGREVCCAGRVILDSQELIRSIREPNPYWGLQNSPLRCATRP